MLYAILCYNDEDVVAPGARRRTSRDGPARRRPGAAEPGTARPGRAAAADDGGDHPAQGERAARHRRPVRRDQGAAARASTSSSAPTSTRRSTIARDLAAANPGGAYELRPMALLQAAGADGCAAMTDLAWIEAALTSARPQAVGALLRYFRDLDIAEEAFQDACLRALKTWPQNGPPRDPAAWLIIVGRNAAHRRGAPAQRKQTAAARRGRSPTSTTPRTRSPSGSTARTTATTSCACCSSAATPTCRRRSRSRWRCASSPGLTVKQIARAFLVGESGHGAAHHARQGADRRAPTCRSRRPGAVERAERLAAVAAMIYLVFNEGYSAGADAERRARRCATRRSGSARLLLRLFPAEPEIMGLTALMLLQHARAAGAVRRATARSCCSTTRTAALWNRTMIAEGLALIDKAMRHRRARALSGPGRDRGAARARGHARRTPTGREIEPLYATLERLQPSPVVTLNRAVAVSQGARPRRRRSAMIEPLADRARRLLPLPRPARRAAAAARAHGRGARGVRPRDRAGEHRRRKPPTSACISIGSRGRPTRSRHDRQKNLRDGVGPPAARASLG